MYGKMCVSYDAPLVNILTTYYTIVNYDLCQVYARPLLIRLTNSGDEYIIARQLVYRVVP
jgi:hypothetical protein